MPRRQTKNRQLILSTLKESGRALSHDGLTSELDKQVDRVTVYRTLNRLVEDGLTHRIVADDGRQYFAVCEEGCSHDHEAHGHLHFRCVNCDRVECVPGEMRFQTPPGYSVENYNLVLSGTCATCAAPTA